MNKIKMQRILADMTQKELAKKLNTKRENISRWENGVCNPKIKQLKQMKIIFGCSFEDLI